MAQEIKRQKVNLGLLLLLLITVTGLGYIVITAKYTENILKSQIKAEKRKIEDNDRKIKDNPMYKRLDAYGYRLGTISAILQYKNLQPQWFQFLREIQSEMPKNGTDRSMTYSSETNDVYMNLVAPTRKRLLETFNSLEDTKNLIDLQYNTISTEKITFKNDKVSYNGYASQINAKIDPEYLKKKFESESEIRAIKYSKENINSGTGETSEEIIVEEQEFSESGTTLESSGAKQEENSINGTN